MLIAFMKSQAERLETSDPNTTRHKLRYKDGTQYYTKVTAELQEINDS